MTSKDVGPETIRCDVELRATFAGGHVVQQAMAYHYNPFAPGATFCSE